ncbi:hymenoptaecin-like [Cotesia glomerata]|uniref:Hymenoptaecin n=1 Tax=Cotesia glomerata TaxID=32391 RepID=A0AAV7I690_COTGL|nr:hymenoptaecin-like [Cotesia glomerata]KAH0546864.1 hypothetical protein KQX54_015658 [Cotesia glomerata]
MKWILVGVLLAISYNGVQGFVSKPTIPRPNQPPIYHPIPPFNPGPPKFPTYRFRRSPQGSLDASVLQSGHGRPQLNLDYQQKFMSNDKERFSGYGGVSSPDFKHFHSHGGLNYEWTPNKDTSLGVHGGVQQLPNGRFDPSVGLNFGMRFRRDVDQQLEE